MLPCGTPESIGIGEDVSLLNVIVRYRHCRYDCRMRNYFVGKFVEFLAGGPDARLYQTLGLRLKIPLGSGFCLRVLCWLCLLASDIVG
jgi:hypothetical protein